MCCRQIWRYDLYRTQVANQMLSLDTSPGLSQNLVSHWPGYLYGSIFSQVFRAVWMVIKEVFDPIEDLVWQLQLCHLVSYYRGMPCGVESFWKCQYEDTDKGVRWQHCQYDVEENKDCCRGWGCWSKSELVGKVKPRWRLLERWVYVRPDNVFLKWSWKYRNDGNRPEVVRL